MKVEKRTDKQDIIGWREWIGLPELGAVKIKAKVDTGARSSSLHAANIEQFTRDDQQWVRFDVLPAQRHDEIVIPTEAKVLEYRSVRSSSGVADLRPVIITEIELLQQRWPIELTLADRDAMGFRMLLGREAFRGRFLVDAGLSYYGGKRIARKTTS